MTRLVVRLHTRLDPPPEVRPPFLATDSYWQQVLVTTSRSTTFINPTTRLTQYVTNSATTGTYTVQIGKHRTAPIAVQSRLRKRKRRF